MTSFITLWLVFSLQNSAAEGDAIESASIAASEKDKEVLVLLYLRILNSCFTCHVHVLYYFVEGLSENILNCVTTLITHLCICFHCLFVYANKSYANQYINRSSLTILV